MSRFNGKAALVTGGARGIGRSIAERLEQEGANVITAQRSPDPARDHILADLSQPQSAASIIDECLSKLGKLDVLINNAGMMQQAETGSMSLQDWQHSISVNLTSPFSLIQAAVPALRQSKGVIVNMGSIEGIAANPGHSAYCASKAGLHGLTKAVAVDLGQYGIRCNAVAPGWIDTELNEEFIERTPDPKAFRRGIAGIHPLRSTGKTEDVASLVAFLAAEESGFITGQIYTIDGGRMTQLSLP